MSQKHEQACTQIVQALTAAMNAASAHCGITLRHLERALPGHSYFHRPESICIFSAGHSISSQSTHETAATSTELRLTARDSDTSPAIHILMTWRNSMGHAIPRRGRDTIPLDNDFITPLDDVATSRIVSDFFHAVFGPVGGDVAMRTLIHCADMQPN